MPELQETEHYSEIIFEDEFDDMYVTATKSHLEFYCLDKAEPAGETLELCSKVRVAKPQRSRRYRGPTDPVRCRLIIKYRGRWCRSLWNN